MLKELCKNQTNSRIEVEDYFDDKIEIAVVSETIDNNIFLEKEDISKFIKEAGKVDLFEAHCAESESDWIKISKVEDDIFINSFTTMAQEECSVTLSSKQFSNILEEVKNLS